MPLFEFTGNKYEIDSLGFLQLEETGTESSEIATNFINEAIKDTDTLYGVQSVNGGSRWNAKTDDIELNFSSFAGADCGRVDPRPFNLGSTFVHELHHGMRGSEDLVGGVFSLSTGWTGPAVDFVNTIRTERGLPLRESCRKLGQMIGRFRRLVGGRPGRGEFLEFTSGLADRAKASGNFVKGKVGQLEDATIFREGDNFLVVDKDGVIRSFVGEADEGGIRELYLSLLSESTIE